MGTDFGLVQGDSLRFTSMGRDMIYRVGFYSEGEHYIITPPLLLDRNGGIRYSEPDRTRSITVHAGKINHGKESNVISGQTYTLQYLDRDGRWQDHETKSCENDGQLTFRNVPADAFYFLSSPSDTRHVARIFLVNEGGEQLWY